MSRHVRTARESVLKVVGFATFFGIPPMFHPLVEPWLGAANMLSNHQAYYLMSYCALFVLTSIAWIWRQPGRVPIPKEREPSEVDASHFGVIRDSYTSVLSLRTDGSATVDDTWVMKRIEPHRFDRIEFSFHVENPIKSDSPPDSLAAFQLHPVLVDGDQVDPEVEVEGSRGTVVIRPASSQWQSIEFRNNPMSLPPGSFFGVGIDELDWSKVETRYPTRRLVSEVQFPPSFLPPAESREFDVLLAGTEIRHHGEYERILRRQGGDFSFGMLPGQGESRAFMRLCVDHPVRGLHYVLRWRPPRA